MPAHYSLILSISLLLSFQHLNAQVTEPIQLDRPDQTECPFITPKKYIQIESGCNIERVNIEQLSFVTPTILWKYGINEKVEFRLITEVNTTKLNAETKTGISPITVGFKTSLCEEHGWLPKVSFIGHITSAGIGSKPFRTKYIAPSFRFTMQHTLSDQIVMAYNLGAEWNGENAEQTYLYTFTTGVGLTKRLGCYAEIYGFLPNDSKADHRIDGGFTYLINNHVITDMSGGFGLTSKAPMAYLSLGFSFRFKAIK